MLNLFLIIPVHNRKELTHSFLKSIFSQTNKNFETVIIDDGSTDGTSLMIQNSFPSVKVINGDGNLWWTGAINLGVKYAIQNGANYILCLNNDLICPNDYIQNILSNIQKYPDSIIGSLVVSHLDEDTIIDGGSCINKYTAKNRSLYNGKKLSKIKFDDEVAKVNILSGRGVVIPAPVFPKIGLFNKKLPQYGADYEFSIRAFSCGINLMLAYNAKVYSFEKTHNIKKRYNELGIMQFTKSLFSKKSSNCILYRYRFSTLSFGKILGIWFFTLDVIRINLSYFLYKYQK